MVGIATPWRRSYGFVLLGTLIVVAVSDYFFYGHPLGWPSAVVALTLFALVAARSTRFLDARGGRVTALAATGLLLALVEQPTWLNVLYALVCLSALALANDFGWESDFARWLRRLARWLASAWANVFLDNGVVVRWLVRRGLAPATARGVAAWVIPALCSTVFVALFAWANPIISGWFGALFAWLGNLLVNLPALLNVGRMAFWLAAATVAWMLLRSRTRGRHGPDERPAAGGVAPIPRVVEQAPPPRVAAGMVIRCLVLFNVIFLVQNALDTRYVWGVSEDLTPLEYREYVRRGAYPLVAAALLAGAFVLVTFRPDSETERSTVARRLVYLWIGQTILLTLSAAWRLERYVEMSELTRLRVASAIWFFLVGTGLFYVIRRIVTRRSNAWLVNVNAVTALLVLYPCCFVNFDGIIADFNARHCQEAGGAGASLDIEYFRTLGPTSVAALDRVRDRIEYGPRRARAEEVSRELHAELDAQLSDWRGWTWRRHRAQLAADEVAWERATAPKPVVVRPRVVASAATR